jgi:hypothetical protein
VTTLFIACIIFNHRQRLSTRAGWPLLQVLDGECATDSATVSPKIPPDSWWQRRFRLRKRNRLIAKKLLLDFHQPLGQKLEFWTSNEYFLTHEFKRTTTLYLGWAVKWQGCLICNRPIQYFSSELRVHTNCLWTGDRTHSSLSSSFQNQVDKSVCSSFYA